MKLRLDCIPCILRQVLRASRHSSLMMELQEKILRENMRLLLKENWNVTPPELAHKAHAIVRKYAGGDPYKEVKKKSNDEALSLYEELKNIVENSRDPLRTAVRIAIAGNIIDFGALEKFDVRRTVEDVLQKNFAHDDYELFVNKLEHASTILYFADNAGEIVFDKLLIETLRKMGEYKITLVVKGGPIINDATMEDVKYVGLHQLVDDIRFLSNGEVGYERNSPEVREWIENHDVVISKGQGNYEGLSEFRGIFYMLIVKCPVVAEDINAKVGDIVLLYR